MLLRRPLRAHADGLARFRDYCFLSHRAVSFQQAQPPKVPNNKKNININIKTGTASSPPLECHSDNGKRIGPKMATIRPPITADSPPPPCKRKSALGKL
jgi:hypothetical protein